MLYRSTTYENVIFLEERDPHQRWIRQFVETLIWEKETYRSLPERERIRKLRERLPEQYNNEKGM